MPLLPPIFLAVREDSAVDVVVWIIAGVIWLLTQMNAAKKKQEKMARQSSPAPSPAARPGGVESPTPDELADIFKRLGADIPGTPAPVPRPSPAPPPARSHGARATLRKPATAVAPALAQRLARVKQEAAEIARRTEAERRIEEAAANAIVPGVQSRAGEHRALDTATRHTGTILPRIYAMGVRLAPLPILPIPGFAPAHRKGMPLCPKLHSRREVRDALIAQVFLQPPKVLAGS